jgi:protein O-mannosyl-transferase
MPKPERFKKGSSFLNADSSNEEEAIASIGKFSLYRDSSKSSLPFLLVLVCISFFIYKSSLLNNFSYDDLSVVVENYYIKSFFYLPSVFDLSYFARFGEESYRPIVTLTYFADFFLWGLSPEGFHFTNIVLHLSVSILIFVLFRRIFSDNLWILFASILFAAHPLTTEAVNAVGFREELLTTFFGLGALLFFWNSLKTSSEFIQRIWINQWLSIVFFFLAMLSKENGMVLLLIFPAIFLLANYVNKLELRKNEIQFGLFLTIAFLGYVFLRFIWFKNPNPNLITPTDIWTRALTGISISGYYLKLLFFPFPLTAAYIFPKAVGWGIVRSLLSLGVFAGISYGIWRSCNRKLLFGWFWFLIALVPTMNIYPIANPIAERYLYFPLVGGVLVISECFRLVLERWNANFPKLTVYIGVLILCAFSIMVSHRNLDWKNSGSLWLQATKVSPMSSRALNGLGIFHMERKDPLRAILTFKRALDINPKNVEAYSNLGLVYHGEHRFKQAEEVLAKALKLSPRNHDTLTNLASAKIELKKYEEASELLARSIQLEPFSVEVHIASGLLNVRLGKPKSGLAFFLRAAEIRPDFNEPWNNIGALYGELGQYNKSVEALKMAVQIDPKDGNSNINLAVALYLLKDYENAKKYAKISYSLGKTLPGFLSTLLNQKAGS